MPRLTAYHVSTEPDLTEIRPYVCDDPGRDGLLYGAEVACFTTTLYNGKLPRFSPYPRSYAAGEVGFRYKMTFDPVHYAKFRMASTSRDGVEQVHFLLLDTRRPRERLVAALVRTCLRAGDDNDDDDEASDWETYFPDGQANDYATGPKIFVNVMFWHSVSVREALVRDTHEVEKRGPRFQRGAVTEPNAWLDRLLARVSNVKQRRAQVEDEDDVDEDLSRILDATRMV